MLLLSVVRHFKVVDPSDVKDAAKLFSVPDFVGDACKAIASHVRGAVAGVQFDDFHKVCLSVCVFVYLFVCVYVVFVALCVHVCIYVLSVLVYLPVLFVCSVGGNALLM